MGPWPIHTPSDGHYILKDVCSHYGPARDNDLKPRYNNSCPFPRFNALKALSQTPEYAKDFYKEKTKKQV